MKKILKAEKSLATTLHKHRKNIQAHSAEFKRIFNRNLRDYYGSNALDMIFGFDIVKFDQDIKTPDGKSMADHITKKYGKEAHDLIKTLIQ